MAIFLASFVLIAVYLMITTFRDKPQPDCRPYVLPLTFDEPAVGPWAYFAEAISPTQRKHF